MKDLRIAAVVCCSPVGRIQRNMDDMTAWVRFAKSEGAQLICFPELNLTGYCTRSGSMPPAISCDDPVVQEIIQLAFAEQVVILTGMLEAGEDDRNYISHLVVSPEGLLGKYRKLHLAPPEKGLFAPGDDVPVFSAAGVTFGIQLCYDAHFPELSTRMAQLGADIIFIPHASPRNSALEKHQSWMRHLPARAYDNGIFIVACNQVGDNCNQMKFSGNALVIGPSGDLIKKTITGNEGLLVSDLKADALIQVRSHPMRYFFPNRRPELYR